MLVGFCIPATTLLLALHQFRRAGEELTLLQARCRAERVEGRSAEPQLDLSDPRLPLEAHAASEASKMLQEPYFRDLNRADQIEIFRRLMATEDARFRALSDYDQMASATAALNWWTGKELPTRQLQHAAPERPECEPTQLAARVSSSGADRLSDRQREIVQAYDAQQQSWDDWSTRLLLGVMLAFGLSVPRLWYFMLDRITELRSAIRGKR